MKELLVALGLLLSGCTHAREVELVVDGYEVGVTEDFDGAYAIGVSDGPCLTAEVFAGVSPYSSVWLRYTANAWGARRMEDPIGRLPDRPLSFAAGLRRDSDCQLVAYGCTPVDPRDTTDTIVVTLDVVSIPCASSCAAGVCD